MFDKVFKIAGIEVGTFQSWDDIDLCVVAYEGIEYKTPQLKEFFKSHGIESQMTVNYDEGLIHDYDPDGNKTNIIELHTFLTTFFGGTHG